MSGGSFPELCGILGLSGPPQGLFPGVSVSITSSIEKDPSNIFFGNHSCYCGNVVVQGNCPRNLLRQYEDDDGCD